MKFLSVSPLAVRSVLEGLPRYATGLNPGKSILALMKQREVANRYADDGCSPEGLKSMWRRP